MTALGHSRRFGRASFTSGLPRQADIFGASWHFAFVPKAEAMPTREHRGVAKRRLCDVY